VCPRADHFSPLFNDPTFRPAKATQYVNGVMASDVEGINPAVLHAERAPTTLRSQFATFKSNYTQALSKFTESGQLDAMDFPNFAGGKTIIMYGHCFFQSDAGSVLPEMATRILPEDAQRDAGVAGSSGARSNDFFGRRKKRARADGGSEQNINLHGMNLFPAVDEASSCASEIAAAEKAVHDANTARHDSMKAKTGALVAILATLKEVRTQIYDAEQEVGVSESIDASLSVLNTLEKSLLKDLSNVGGGT
jgi:hypothetical protein